MCGALDSLKLPNMSTLPGFLVALVLLRRVHGLGQFVEHARPVSVRVQLVQGAGADQHIHGPLVNLVVVHPVAEIGQVAERPVGFPVVLDDIDGRMAHAFQRAQPVTDGGVVQRREGMA